MSVSIGAENLSEALGRKDYVKLAVESLLFRDLDVHVLTDAYSVQNPEHHAVKGSDYNYVVMAEERLNSEGYTLLEMPYGEADDWHHDRSIAIVSRLAIEDEQGVPIGHRFGLRVVVADPDTNVPLTVVGMHGDDRSEERRLAQVEGLETVIDRDNMLPTVLAGDLNMLQRNDPKARLVRSLGFRAAGHLLPTPYMRSQARRLSEMGQGEAFSQLTQRFGLTETAPKRFPTKGWFQLDHILISSGVTLESFTIERRPRPWYTDHNAISAVVSADKMPLPRR